MSIFDSYYGEGTIQYAAVAATADGDNTVVAAVAAKKIRVIGYMVMASAAGTVLFKSGAGTTLATLTPAVNGGASYAGGPAAPAFETVAGSALVINNAAGVDTNGHLAYVLI